MLWSISVIDDILHDSLSACLLLLILSLFSLFLVLTFHHILAAKSSTSGNLRETSPRHHLILSIVFSPTQWAPSPTPFIICYLKGRCLWCCEKSGPVQSWFSQGSFPTTKPWKQPPTENAPSNCLAHTKPKNFPPWDSGRNPNLEPTSSHTPASVSGRGWGSFNRSTKGWMVQVISRNPLFWQQKRSDLPKKHRFLLR